MEVYIPYSTFCTQCVLKSPMRQSFFDTRHPSFYAVSLALLYRTFDSLSSFFFIFPNLYNLILILSVNHTEYTRLAVHWTLAYIP